jgi:Flp pilus assembly pilin Flp
MHHRVPVHLRAIARIVAGRPARDDDRGQTTAEYGLVMLAAGTIAVGVITWATRTQAFTDLFQSVIDKLSP